MNDRLESLEDVAELTEGKPLLLFDGVCNLCASSVQFLIKRDPKAKVRFASLQSEVGEKVIELARLKNVYMNTIVLVDKGKVLTRSNAALRVTRYMRGGWPLLQGFLIIPEFIRDAVYELIANNRYKWFGKQELCWMPTPELRSRFLDQA